MKKLFALVLICAPLAAVYSQDDLLKELEQNDKNDTDYAFQTFKGTRIVNGHTVETKGKGTLEFIFAHRFGAVNTGLYELFGLDNASVRLGLDYGITDNFSVSIGRNSEDKIMDGYLKYKLIRQSKGAKNFPFTITALTGAAYSINPKRDQEPDDFKTSYRLAYTTQLLIARKFSPNFSLQLMPTYIHKNAVHKVQEENDHLALGFGGRIKLTRSVAITTEYYYRINPPDNANFVLESEKRYNALGFGIDIETGGHVFQLILTNTSSLTERTVITETKDDFFAGDIHLGFNVTRTFQLKKKK
jgi:hypothetical protein